MLWPVFQGLLHTLIHKNLGNLIPATINQGFRGLSLDRLEQWRLSLGLFLGHFKPMFHPLRPEGQGQAAGGAG